MPESLYDSFKGPSSRESWILAAATFNADVVVESPERPTSGDFYADDQGRPKRVCRLKNAVTATGGLFEPVILKADESRRSASQLCIRDTSAVVCFAGGCPTDSLIGELPQTQMFTFGERVAGNLANADDAVAPERAPVTLPPDTGPIAELMLYSPNDPEDRSYALNGQPQ